MIRLTVATVAISLSTEKNTAGVNFSQRTGFLLDGLNVKLKKTKGRTTARSRVAWNLKPQAMR